MSDADVREETTTNGSPTSITSPTAQLSRSGLSRNRWSVVAEKALTLSTSLDERDGKGGDAVVVEEEVVLRRDAKQLEGLMERRSTLLHRRSSQKLLEDINNSKATFVRV